MTGPYDSVVTRLPSDDAVAARFADWLGRQISVLRALGAHTDVPVPEVLEDAYEWRDAPEAIADEVIQRWSRNSAFWSNSPVAPPGSLPTAR
jgi:hypothetical protein